MWRLRLLIIFATTVFPWLTQAQNIPQRRWLALTVAHSQYADIRSGQAQGPPQGLEPTLDIELDFRPRSYFNLAFVYGQTEDRSVTNIGYGMRVDTPGVFFFGWNSFQDFRLRQKRQPVNTSLFGYVVQQSATPPGATALVRYIGSNLGLSIDIFLMNPNVYLTLQASIFNMRGNGFLSQTIGLGVEY